jgi:alpha-ketoglutarate-dependent taurine dioxygenase
VNDDAVWKPTEITPEIAGTGPGLTGLLAYLGDVEKIDGLLISERALIFRGFDITPGKLDDVMNVLLRDRLAYIHGNSPRTKVGNNVYTSTEYPAEFTISMHNELSYAARWPARLLFFCETPPAAGGATSLTDGARWLGSLDPEVREAFSGGVRYTQNLPDGRGLGRSWQDTFETGDRDEVEAYLSTIAAEWEWTLDGLRVTQVRPATTSHPVTDARVWFNQSDQWHAAALDDETSIALLDILPEEELPQSVRFANGAPIPAEYIMQVKERGMELAVDVDWRTPGDLLLIDNILVAHGRRPFSGSRRVLVAMSD